MRVFAARRDRSSRRHQFVARGVRETSPIKANVQAAASAEHREGANTVRTQLRHQFCRAQPRRVDTVVRKSASANLCQSFGLLGGNCRRSERGTLVFGYVPIRDTRVHQSPRALYVRSSFSMDALPLEGPRYVVSLSASKFRSFRVSHSQTVRTRHPSFCKVSATTRSSRNVRLEF